MDGWWRRTSAKLAVAAGGLALTIGCTGDPHPGSDVGGEGPEVGTDATADTGGSEASDTSVLDGALADAGGSDASEEVADADDSVDGGLDASSDGGDGDASEDDSHLPPAQGTGVTVLQFDGEQGRSYVGRVSFPSFGESAFENCSFTIEGSCRLVECDGQIVDGEPELRSAGTVEVSNGTETMTFSPDEEGSYEILTEEGSFWDGDETISVEASGDTVSGFELDVSPPSPTRVTSPDLPDDESLWTIDRSQPLTIEWATDGIDRGTFFARLSSYSSGRDETAAISCGWDATDGSRQIPASLLEHMETGETVSGSYQFTLGDYATTTAGDETVGGLAGTTIDDEGVSPETGGRVFFE